MRILRTGKCTALGWLVCLLSLTSVSGIARAEPYLAIQNGYTCSNCHVNPTGGGMRTTFGDIFAQTLLPAYAAPSGSPVWTGQLLQQVLRLGGDVRTDFARTSTSHSSTVQQFSLEQARVYTDISIIPDRLGVYVDQLIAPGTQNMEAYVRYGNPANWYLKAGHFYLPFGWRLQDQSAFVREVTGINMNTPDTGAEFGLKRGRLKWQIDASNGAANQASSGQNSGGGSGYMAKSCRRSRYGGVVRRAENRTRRLARRGRRRKAGGLRRWRSHPATHDRRNGLAGAQGKQPEVHLRVL